MQIQHLVTSGCSFSETRTGMHTWPFYTSDYLNLQLHNQALGSQGNQHIARKLIYQTNLLLEQGVDPSEILCMVMWSGPNRTEYYSENPLDSYPQGEGHDVNPDRFVPNDSGGWIIQNSHWQSCASWYRNYESFAGAQIRFYESVIHAQSWCDSQGLQLIHSLFRDDVRMSRDSTHPSTAWMHRVTDQYQWLPKNCFDWCKTESNLPFPSPTDWHPSTEQHKLYTETVILPYVNSVTAE
jgi:hypothetical protein